MANPFRAMLLLALSGLALLLVAGAASATAAERTVSVSARATIEVPNDSAGVGLSVSVERRTRAAALGAASERLRRVIAAVQTIPGVGPGDVTTGRISVRKSLRGRVVRYRAGQGISVVLHEPDRAGDLVSAAIAAGAGGISGPRFFVGDAEAAYGGALAAAFDRAKAKAATLATQAGSTLGPAISIQEGGAPEPPGIEFSAPNSAEGCAPVPETATASACATVPPPVKPGTTTVTAAVGVVFALL
jgi:uncharacterized protein YggE